MKGREKWEGVIQMGGSVPITGYASCNSLKPGTPKPQVDKNEKFNLWITQKIKQKRKKCYFSNLQCKCYTICAYTNY